MTFRTRFAPSPTGPLHLGHAYSAMLGFDLARAEGGEWLLRIEDIDRQRSRPDWEAEIHEDLGWLGLRWPRPVMRQSGNLAAYRAALLRLWDRGLAFECACSRADVAAAVAAPQEGGPPAVGPDGLVYPGTCRPWADWRPLRSPSEDAVLRLFSPAAAAVASAQGPLRFEEAGRGPAGQSGTVEFGVAEVVDAIGDVVLARRGMGTSYHLSVVVDDAAQGITDVVRGEDLFEATKIHVVLQRLLGLPTPTYRHHRLIRDESGRRLAKREDARAIRRYREEGATPADIRRMVGLAP